MKIKVISECFTTELHQVLHGVEVAKKELKKAERINMAVGDTESGTAGNTIQNTSDSTRDEIKGPIRSMGTTKSDATSTQRPTIVLRK